MFSFGVHAPGRSRLRALRELYRRFLGENCPEARGQRLLREWLSVEQRAQFDAHRHFDVIGCDSGTRYRIHYGTAANVQELNENGSPRASWCFLPSGYLVAGDILLVQKIALETNEQAALAVANRFPPTLPALRGARR